MEHSSIPSPAPLAPELTTAARAMRLPAITATDPLTILTMLAGEPLPIIRATGAGLFDSITTANLALVRMTQAVFRGLERGAGQQSREADSVDFAIALSIALEIPDALARWLRGERVFERAYIPKTERPPPVMRLTVVE